MSEAVDRHQGVLHGRHFQDVQGTRTRSRTRHSEDRISTEAGFELDFRSAVAEGLTGSSPARSFAEEFEDESNETDNAHGAHRCQKSRRARSQVFT